MDRDFEDGDEPVKLCLKGGRPVEFRKKASGSYDMVGESVGFFRLAPAVAAALARAAQSYVDAGRLDEPYEEAIRDVLLAGGAGPFGWEDVTGLPWIEIDFPDDVRRAREEIMPCLDDD